VVHEGRYATVELERVLAGRGPSRVVMETCAESYAVAAAAQQAGRNRSEGGAGFSRVAG